jgi:hypothetical protein
VDFVIEAAVADHSMCRQWQVNDATTRRNNREQGEAIRNVILEKN